MAVASGLRRPGRLVVMVLLAVLLTALGVVAQLQGGGGRAAPASEPWGPGAAVDGSHVNVMPPVRSVGRPAAEPALLTVYGAAEPVPLGTLPLGVPPSVLPLLDGRDVDVSLALRAAHQPTVSGRAPPFRQPDL